MVLDPRVKDFQPRMDANQAKAKASACKQSHSMLRIEHGGATVPFAFIGVYSRLSSSCFAYAWIWDGCRTATRGGSHPWRGVGDPSRSVKSP
jgi:hypothetical protein